MTAFSFGYRLQVTLFFLLFLVVGCAAQECKTSSDMDAATKSSLEAAAQRYYKAAATGNTAELQQNAIPAIASDFGGIQGAINENKNNLGTSATIRSAYELDAPGNAPIARAEFFCGIVNSANYVAFQIPNLPPGIYGVVTMDAQGGKDPLAVSFVLQQSGAQWKIGGVYLRRSAIGGHDSQWYVSQAQQYKAKGQSHNAWLYYLTAWDLAAPLPFMGSVKLDKLVDEMQSARPADLPSSSQPLQLPSAGKAYSVTQLFAVPVTDGLSIVVKYQVPDVSNTTNAYADNMAVMRALLAKYPEFREGFSSVVARAVAPSGQDYGTLLAMKDIK
jgi:hypothetical protein